MFGLTFEKLLVIGVIAAFLIGPERLPQLADSASRLLRRLAELRRSSKARLEEEFGEDLDWRKLDPRQYDPRRIIRDSLGELFDGSVETPHDEGQPPAPPPEGRRRNGRGLRDVAADPPTTDRTGAAS